MKVENFDGSFGSAADFQFSICNLRFNRRFIVGPATHLFVDGVHDIGAANQEAAARVTGGTALYFEYRDGGAGQTAKQVGKHASRQMTRWLLCAEVEITLAPVGRVQRRDHVVDRADVQRAPAVIAEVFGGAMLKRLDIEVFDADLGPLGQPALEGLVERCSARVAGLLQRDRLLRIPTSQQCGAKREE